MNYSSGQLQSIQGSSPSQQWDNPRNRTNNRFGRNGMREDETQPNDSGKSGYGMMNGEDKTSAQSGMEYGTMKVPQIGRGPTSMNNTTGLLLGQNNHNSSPSPRGGGGSGLPGPGPSVGLIKDNNLQLQPQQQNMRHRSTSRQAGQRARRMKQIESSPAGPADPALNRSMAMPFIQQQQQQQQAGAPGAYMGGTGDQQHMFPQISTPSQAGKRPVNGVTPTAASSTMTMNNMMTPTPQQLQMQAMHPSMNQTLNMTQPQQPQTRDNLPVYTEEHKGAACTSIKGLKPGNPAWLNQDNFFIQERIESKDVSIYCVLDGHGEHGHHVSRRCREVLPLHMRSSLLDTKKAFLLMQSDLLAAADFDARCSGATCVMAVLIGGRLAVSNCGDSRAIVGRRNANGSISAHPVTNDHKPDRPEERKRILGCGGHLGCRQVLVNQPGKGPVSMPVGPCRVWYQNRGETLGLAMSRSLGDTIVHKSGVSAEPEIIEHTIDDMDEFIILATDGVWDVVDNNQAVQMVHSVVVKSANWSPLEASICVCKFARSRWEKLSPMVDDITCVVVKLSKQ